MSTKHTLLTLEQSIQERLKSSDANASYVASLAEKGLDTILKKIGEEATEAVIAAKGDDPEKIIYETADLWFHTMVMLAYKGIAIEQIMAELERRMGVSGLDEKAARK